VVDEDACELVADGAVHQCGRNCRVHSPGKAADGAAVTDLIRYRLDLLGDDVRHRPGGLDSGQVVQEVLDDRLPVGGMAHLWVVLHPGQPPASIFEGGDRCPVRSGEDREPLRCGDHPVAVRHPDLLLDGQAGQDASRVEDPK
jgi:hypothetical protein